MANPVDAAALEPLVIEADRGGHRVSFALLPRLGAQLASFAVDGQELLHFSRERVLQEGPTTGCFLMFPTPCRLTGSRYRFGGQEIRQTKAGREVSIHGLVRDEPFAVTGQTGAALVTLDIGPGHPVYEGYPFTGRLAVRYQAIEVGLRIDFSFHNQGDRAAPFGFGVHPYWRLEADRQDHAIRVPCEHAMELAELIPTGKLEPVAGTRLDLREWTSLAGMDIDHAFCGRLAGVRAGVEWRGRGRRLWIDASPELTHMIAYAPAGQPFVCVESLTCAPDMPNLYGKGFHRESGMVVVPPGQRHGGWITWTIEDL